MHAALSHHYPVPPHPQQRNLQLFGQLLLRERAATLARMTRQRLLATWQQGFWGMKGASWVAKEETKVFSDVFLGGKGL